MQRRDQAGLSHIGGKMITATRIGALFLLPAAPLYAQSSGAVSGSLEPVRVIQPSAGSGQVGQPPQNSAMRGVSGARPSRASGAGNATSMGAAGGDPATDALTLSSPMGASAPGARPGAVRITDTGITQRTPARGAGDQ